jgi:hypothetical protein
METARTVSRRRIKKYKDHAVCVGPTYFDCIQDRHYYVREVIAAPKHTNASEIKAIIV